MSCSQKRKYAKKMLYEQTNMISRKEYLIIIKKDYLILKKSKEKKIKLKTKQKIFESFSLMSRIFLF